jgi:DNA polymerase-3 subunit alpha
MPINTHTYYSLRYGTVAPEALIEQAKQMDMPALALTDINNTTGMPDFVKLCNEKGIKPLAGVEFRGDDFELLYIGLARNNEGFRELNEYLTLCNEAQKPFLSSPPPMPNVYVIYPFGKKLPEALNRYEYIGVKPGDLNRLIATPYIHNRDKLIVQYPVTFLKDTDYLLHKHLRAIDNNILLSQLPHAQLAGGDEKMVSYKQLKAMYKNYPWLIDNTERLMADCSIDMDFSTVKNKKYFTGSRYDDRILLEKLAREGMMSRYGAGNKEAAHRVHHELKIIDELGFSSYFLITWDVIRYSLQRGFYHVGRGSGANSIVAYCLKITDVDPIELNLYFERFINPKRTSPPDFDIDYSWQERDDVLDYIFKRYGKKHTALLGTMSTFKGRSIFRELGKVYGLPKEEIDQFVKYPHKNQNHITKRILYLGNLLLDFPNQRSIHAGGVLISEQPVTYYTALDYPPKGMPTTQWDMYVADALKFEKLDILSQRGIGHINDTVEIVKRNRKIDVDMHDIDRFKSDPRTRQFLRAGETLGCFYIESPAMRGLLNKLRCDDYPALVAASSIIRPGVAKSGMMKEYILRFHDPGRTRYLHPIMKGLLEETYGVMVYQEDVIRVCHYFAGLDLSDADILRRAMSGKFRSRKEFDRIRDKFYANCKERGYPDHITKEVWRQMESFAGYSFSKAHSASYAVESFQSLFLKAHFPLEFMVGVINNFGGFYRLPVYINEVKRYGGQVHLPCINRSGYLTSIKAKNVFLGFVHVLKLEYKLANALVKERDNNGLYSGLDDLVNRVPLHLEQLILLIRIDALRFTSKTKKELLWEAHMLLGKKSEPVPNELFKAHAREYTLPALEQSLVEDAYDEVELLGFPVSVTMFDLLKTSFRGELAAHQLMEHTGKKVRLVGELVHIKNVRTVHKQWMHFGTWLDANGAFFDTVHFPDSLKHSPFRGNGVYLILGTITQEFGYPSVTVGRMAKLPVVNDPRYE